MSDPATAPEAFSGREAFKRRGFRIFGLGLQDAIRYFFGGNASLAIVFIILICVFLSREGIMFFPDHHEGLRSYREAGQEYVDYLGEEINAHNAIYSSANIAYFAEINESSVAEDDLLRATRAVFANVERITDKSWGLLKRKIQEEVELAKELEKLGSGSPEAAAVAATLDSRRGEIAALRKQLRSEVEAALDTSEGWDMGVGARSPLDSARDRIREAVLFAAFPGAKEEHPYLLELKAASKAKKAEAATRLVAFKATLTSIQEAIKPLRTLHGELRNAASENRTVINSFKSAPQRRAALLEGITKTADPGEKARLQAEADAVETTAPDLVAMNAPFYAAVPKHRELVIPLQTEMDRLFDALPTDSSTESARENLKHCKVLYKRFENTLEENRDNVAEWRHDRPVSWVGSISAFILGKQWITNSSWHDFYGLLPLLTGSFLISIIALIVAVPFSVAAAIYVNQLASRREQQIIKPSIEFIGAIPSVVLGFFGILVFGETLRAVSQVEWLSWVPGFPMAERLTILNAGLLLAFMAVPTIFTLTEDALENVPAAFSENSFAMGASKLQTVFRVVLPTAVSGVIAAILLGFGRIIGETMVVLLVAGNKIKIPDFSEGFGVIAQPTHTMTGIIAQELGEVDGGSLHWRALFIIGMVLFVIALLVNYAAQQALKRFQKI